LDGQHFPAPTWLVPGALPEGFGILAAPPKAGKSWLVLAIGLGLAAGTPVLGVAVDQRPVLYLSLEDSWRRLQHRCRTLLDGSIPSSIYFEIDAANALKVAEKFTARHRDALVILDTLGRVKPNKGANTNQYANDYEFGRALKELAPQRGSLLAVRHMRKADSEDFLDDVTGTQGLAGSADYVMVLQRRRLSASGTLNITGRDVDEARYALLFADGRWSADGSDLQQAAERAADKSMGDNARSVVALVNSRPATTADDVVRATGMKPDAARKLSREHWLPGPKLPKLAPAAMSGAPPRRGRPSPSTSRPLTGFPVI
jgi:RecA-family ATPase